MKKFLAIYTGSPNSASAQKWNALPPDDQRKIQLEGITAWQKWGEKNAKAIIDTGAPLGKTKRVDSNGISDIKNLMTAYTVIEAESHEEAARIFLGHPHFSLFPGDGVEIMECLQIPTL